MHLLFHHLSGLLPLLGELTADSDESCMSFLALARVFINVFIGILDCTELFAKLVAQADEGVLIVDMEFLHCRIEGAEPFLDSGQA